METIFGVPGEENADLLISLLDSPIEFVICRHEQAAAFMADVHGRLTGMPGICLSTLGPGATNLVTGVASANMDHSPLVAIVGQATTKRLHKESHQNMDAIRMFEPITKWATSVRDADNIPEVIRKVFKLAGDEKPGATVIEFPEDIAKEDTDEVPIPPRGPDRGSGADIFYVERALELLAEATTPVILAGHGCVRQGASDALTRFAERTGIYAANTFMGKGAISARDPHCLYAVGLTARDVALEAFEKADLVICIGYDMVEWHPESWNVGRSKRIIHIDTEPAEADKHYVADVEIVGDIVAILAEINTRLGSTHRKETPQFGELRKLMSQELHEHDADDGFPMKPQRILSDLRLALRDEDLLISDVGAHKMWVARHYPTYVAETCFITNGFCSMGFALPGAIAAKKLHPDRNVVALCGDGGFLMNVQDLITAVRYDAPITAVVWEDHRYGLIEWKQQVTYGSTSYADLVNPDFVKLAEAFGCGAIRVETAEAFRPALERAFAEPRRPTVILVPVDSRENLKLTRRLGNLVAR